MKLPKEDADLFFKLMWGLQCYVNQQLRLLPDVKSTQDYAELPSASRIQVRDALWAPEQQVRRTLSRVQTTLHRAER